MSNPSTLTTYAVAFLTSVSLFGLVDAGRVNDAALVASAITQAFLLPILGISSAIFLGLTILVLSRSFLGRPHGWNSDRTERALLEVGLALRALAQAERVEHGHAEHADRHDEDRHVDLHEREP